MTTTSLDERFRRLATDRTGGKSFDAPAGGYSFSKVLAEERELLKGNVEGDKSSALCRLSIADPIRKMPMAALEAGKKYYIENAYATRYTDNNGIPGTHEKLAEYLNREHPGSGPFDASWVQYSPGSIKRALAEYVPTALFDKDSLLIFPTPGYGVIKSAMNRHEAEVCDLPLQRFEGDRWDVDYNLASQAVVKHRTGASEKKVFLYLNVPQNPTGFAYSADDWISALNWARSHRVMLIVDEAYTHLRFSEDTVSVLDIPGWQDCCVVLQSVSKGWNATGLRIGWIVAHPTLVSLFRTVMDVKDSGAFGPNIAAALWCLEHRDYAVGTKNKYRELHMILAAGLRQAGVPGVCPDAGLCQFTRAPLKAGDIHFQDAGDCGRWFRHNLRVSLMHYEVNKEPWLRWAVTIASVPECGLNNEDEVIAEVLNRLSSIKFEF